MRKLFMLVAATAMLALGGVAVAGGGGDGGKKNKKKAKFDSTVTLVYNQGPYTPNDPYYSEATFSGQVTATPANKPARKSQNGKTKCEKKRTVIIKNLDAPEGTDAFATTKTDSDGSYAVEADEAYTEPGTYRAKVQKKRKVKAEIKCFGGKSNEVEVSAP